MNQGNEKNAARRYLWCTMDSVLVRDQGVHWPIPFAAVCTPFSEGTDSTTMPVSDPKAVGLTEPIRCHRCRCYANPYFRCSKQERERLVCNFCGHRVEVTDSMLQNIDDEDSHPELFYGSVDIVVAPEDFGLRRPTGPALPATVFVLESSAQAVASGFFSASLAALELAVSGEHAPLRRHVSLILYDDEAITFVVPTPNWSFRLVVMNTVDDPFLPVSPEEIYLDASGQEDQALWAKVLKQLGESWSPTPNPEARGVAGGAAVQCALEAMCGAGGGDIVAFHASSPSVGVGAIHSRRDSDVVIPQNAPYYERMLADCIKSGVAVSAITAPAPTVQLDAGTLHWIAWRTGGDVLHLPDFVSDNAVLTTKLAGTMLQWSKVMMRSAYGCIFKLRTSRGLSCVSLSAPWPAAASSRDNSVFEISRLSPDATVTCTMQADADTAEDAAYRDNDRRLYHFVQVAVLYSNARGERLLRNHTLLVGLAHTPRVSYQSVNIAPMAAFYLKKAAEVALSLENGSRKASKGTGSKTASKEALKETPKDFLLNSLVKVLVHAMRYNTQELVAKGFLTPKKLALFPLYMLGARKLFGFMRETNKDVERGMLHAILRMPIHTLMAMLYPRAYVFNTVQEKDAYNGGVSLPPPDVPTPWVPWKDILINCKDARLVMFVNGVSILLHKMQGTEIDEATEFKLQQRATNAYGKIVESMEPTQALIPLHEFPKHGMAPSSPASEKALLATIFVEDEGFNEMSYTDWVAYLYNEILKVQERSFVRG